ncbi:hypothetical protein Syun_025257 [Stephania yunnanensis]|uniref:BTB/POZ domain-containing protein NPY1 n=1 Tax=Stephania yunnanensis TaxID=152371 RepID=A0AAP0EUA3_9MAGN
MKFMKLGSKADTFQGDGSCGRFVASELPTDVVIVVGDVKFSLHKFPLLSKCNYLQKLVLKANEISDEIHLPDFPGGPKAFEICAKFCYGMTVTLNAYNVVAARCAAEYLGMAEEVERGNLIFKIEVFLNSSIFRSWKDTIIVLQTARSLLPWSEDLKVIGRCIDSIASKTSVDPSSVHWSYTYNRKAATPDQIHEVTARPHHIYASVPKDWWVEDICELEIDCYKRVMFAIKAKGRMSAGVIGEALQAYAIRWLPNSVDALVSEDHVRRNKALVETIIWLLPSDKVIGGFCSFLLKLLKVSILVGVGDGPRDELIKKISLQLYNASLDDLLIPARSSDIITVYDIGLMQTLVNQFAKQHSHDVDYVEGNETSDDFAFGHDSWLKVGKLVDGYLGEVAQDPNLPLSSFIELSQSVPDSARDTHDDLYKAIDKYLREHPGLTKFEKRKICGLMDVKKLTSAACMNAAQNERLPLRVVVQVLFFEQVRAAATGLNAPQNLSCDSSQSTPNTQDFEKAMPQDLNILSKQMGDLKISEKERSKNWRKDGKKGNKSKAGRAMLLSSRSRRIFDRFWVAAKGNGENRSSETSGSSLSPTSFNPGETKSSGSSSRHRRHSIS